MALALIVGISACGGEDQAPAEEAAPRLTKAQLVERLGDICQEHTDLQVVEREKFGRKHGIPSQEDATQPEYEEEIIVVILPIVRDTIRDVERLRPPSSEEAKLDAFIGALRDAVARTQAHPEELAAEAGQEPFSRARSTAADLGAYYCGQA